MDRAPDFGSVGSGFDSWLGHLNAAINHHLPAIYGYKKVSIKWRPFLVLLLYSYPFIGEISQKAGLRGLPFFEFNQYYSHITA